MKDVNLKKQTLNTILKNDLSAFVQKVFNTVSASDVYCHNWHIDVIADYLTRCCNGDENRLIINIPPRYLKSICGSIALPAWILGHDPTRRIISVTHSGDLSSKFARDSKAVMQSDWYRSVFPKTRLRRRSELDLETTRGGVRFASSVTGTLTGRGGDFIIIDDPIKPEEVLSENQRKRIKDWYDNTLYTRLNSRRDSVIIIIMQRLHMDDLVAYVQEKEDWLVLDLPAIAELNEEFKLSDGRTFCRQIGEALHPEREPLNILSAIRQRIGEYNFACQFQQRPIPLGGNLITWDDFRYFDGPCFPDRADYVVQSWDTASKDSVRNDYSVCLTFIVRGDKYLLIDVYRERVNFTELKKSAIQLADRFRPRKILIEDTGSGTPLVQEFKDLYYRSNFPFPEAIIPRGDKAVRMDAQCQKISDGQVLLDKNASWLNDFHDEIVAFPFGKHDDMVDALSQFLYWISERTRRTVRIEKLTGL